MYSARSRVGRRSVFGSSGLLYRSNKLMFDRATLSLWHQLTGEPVLGPAAREPALLVRIPSTVATWGEWRRRHPATTAVRLDQSYGDRWGFVYLPGAADRKRAGVSFPVWRQSARLPRDTEVIGVRLAAGANAWPLARLLEAGLLNDTVGGENVVLVVEPAGRAVRVYARGLHRFTRAPDGELTDESQTPWRVTEPALVPAPESGEAALPRLPAQNALWFGWFGMVPDTELGGTPDDAHETPPPPRSRAARLPG